MRAKLDTLGLQPLGDAFRPTTKPYIEALEDDLGQALPDDYRAFLAHYGVCTLTDYVTFALPGGPRIDINMFLGNDPDDSYDLREVWRSMREDHDANLLPIAVDPFGNVVCLDMNSATLGHIRFIDHETATVSFVAPSFTAFIGMLRREPP